MELNSLVLDSSVERREAVTNRELQELLTPYIEIESHDEETATVRFNSEYNELNERTQVLVCFFGVEALYRLDFSDSRTIKAVDLLTEFELTEGTHYPYVRELEQEGILWRNDMGYMISTTHLVAAKEEVEN